ncbi:hypothetical protein ATANTOWER_020005 [Ataeniobius toweri]|uniref:Uncharacterized protein n=1 Tax=Ataeniobius toweri TaxID=208326 RepID=A0ABU7A7X9_9TELE|nr:hypothetical protein [Ataeniobius toweri]
MCLQKHPAAEPLSSEEEKPFKTAPNPQGGHQQSTVTGMEKDQGGDYCAMPPVQTPVREVNQARPRMGPSSVLEWVQRLVRELCHWACFDGINEFSCCGCLGLLSCWKVNLHPSLQSSAASNRFSSRIGPYLAPSILLSVQFLCLC